jgi:tetratricopeptide (TPR) repeat protein
VRLGNADLLPLAMGFGFAAGLRQNAVFDHAGAVATLRQALQLWSRLPASERDAVPVAPIHQRLGHALKALRDDAGAAEAFRAAIATATCDMDRARGYTALSWLPYEHGGFDRSVEVLREGIAAVSDPVARAYLESGLGWIRGRQGSWTAAYELLEPTIAVLEQAPPDILARALDRFAVAMRDLGTPERAIHVFRRALILCRETANVHEESIVRMHLATALRDAGDATGALPEVSRAIELTRMTGDRYIEAVSHWILAEVEDTLGNLDGAARARRAELEILGSIGGNPQNQAMAHAHLAHLAKRAGDASTARVEADAARGMAAHAGLDYLPALVERAIGAANWFLVSHRHADEDGEERPVAVAGA